MLLGLDLERLARWKGFEKRRLFLSSLGLSVSVDLLLTFSGVVTNSGSSEASREEGADSDSDAYITINTCTISEKARETMELTFT